MPIKDGFLKFPREESGKQRVVERVRHWHEYEQVMPVEQATTQAMRCMDCGTPDCHAYCPVHNLIPDWNALVSETDWRIAWEQLESTNNFPEFTGRLCSAPCEDACTLSIGSQPVTIRSIELAIVEHAWAAGWIKPQRAVVHRFKRVAVVGSGPAGLTCAQQLARAGYRVTVHEKADRIGGLLRYGIPDFRQEKAAIDRRLAQLVAEGVIFKTNAAINSANDIDRLRRSVRAVVLACGAEQPRELDVPGRELNGIHFAMEYLSQQNRRVAGDEIPYADSIDARGKDVVVIGGGDTGSDCVGTAIRQGARSVTQIQHHDRPPANADVLQYWPEHVPVYHENDHDDEGCRHLWGWDTTAFEGYAENVEELALQHLQWVNQDGVWHKSQRPGERKHIPAQLVLLATGFAGPWHLGLINQAGLATDARGNVSATDNDYQTSLPGIFTCGDMRRGQSLIVWAIREGRQCAHAVDEWLSGSSDLPVV